METRDIIDYGRKERELSLPSTVPPETRTSVVTTAPALSPSLASLNILYYFLSQAPSVNWLRTPIRNHHVSSTNPESEAP